MRAFVYTAMLIWALGLSALAAEVKFKATWDPPTKDIAGNPATATDYVVYVCDQAIGSRFATANPSEPSVMGECLGGTLKTYTTSEPRCEASYLSNQESGTLYFRVSARREYANGAQTILVESDLSEQASMAYSPYIPMMPPGKPVVETPNSVTP